MEEGREGEGGERREEEGMETYMWVPLSFFIFFFYYSAMWTPRMKRLSQRMPRSTKRCPNHPRRQIEPVLIFGEVIISGFAVEGYELDLSYI